MATNVEDSTSTSVQQIDVEVEISFDRPTHSYSQEKPPNVTLTIKSQADHPITIFTWRSPLDLKNTFNSEGFTITDAATGQPVKTNTFMNISRPNLKRVRGNSDEQYYITIQPKTPLKLSTGFGPGGGIRKPLPYSVIKCGHVLDENGNWNERSPRRSTQASGVEGLEPDHKYIIGLNLERLKRCRWAPVDKEEILVDHMGAGSDVGDYPSWRIDSSLVFYVKEAELSVFD